MKRFLVGEKTFWWTISSLALGYLFTIAVFDAPIYPRGMPKLEILWMGLFCLAAAIFIFFLGRAVFPLLRGLPAKSRLVWGLIAFATALLLTLVIPLQPQKLWIQQASSNSDWELLLYLPALVWISFFILAFSAWLALRPARIVKPEVFSKWTTFLYALPMFTAWAVYLLAYWPGGMSPDSIDQWTQMLAFRFSDWHPVFHTLTNWLITRLWLSPAAVGLVQIFFLSLVLGWGLRTLRGFGAPRWVPWLVIVFLVIAPSTGLMAIMLWKDVFFSIAVVALSIQVLKITMTEGEWIQRRAGWLYLGLTATLVALYRQNGPTAAFGTLFCLLIVYCRFWKRLVFALLLALALWAGIRGPGYDLLGVDRNTPSGMEMTLAHIIAPYTNSNTPILPPERALLARIRPGQVWPYDCYMETNLYFDGKFTYTSSENFDLAVLFTRLVVRNPRIFVGHIICNSSFLYQITRTPGSAYETTVPYITSNQLGLVSQSQLPDLKTVLDRWTAFSLVYFDWLFWRAALWGYLLLAGILVYSARSKNWKALLVMIPVLANMLPLALLANAQEFRYVFSTFLVGVLMSAFFLFKRDVQE